MDPPRLEWLARNIDVDDWQMVPLHAESFHRNTEALDPVLDQLALLHESYDRDSTPLLDGCEIKVEVTIPGATYGACLLFARAERHADEAASWRFEEVNAQWVAEARFGFGRCIERHQGQIARHAKAMEVSLVSLAR